MPEFLELASIFRDFGDGCEISLDSSQKLFKTPENQSSNFFAKLSLQI